MAMMPCKCGHPNNRHGLGHPCNVQGCPCPNYRAASPYTDTYCTQLASGLVRVDSPGGHAIYDCTRLDTFGRFPLTHGWSTVDRRAAVVAFVASLPCAAAVMLAAPDEASGCCGRPSVIFLTDNETWPVCDTHNERTFP